MRQLRDHLLLLLLVVCTACCSARSLRQLCEVRDGRTDVYDVEGGAILPHDSINLMGQTATAAIRA